MLIKSADPTSKQRIALLESLQKAGRLDAFQARWVATELARQRAGHNGERDAAYYIDTHFTSSQNIAVLHDLRLVVDGDVAQIDHLLISRGGSFYLLETKNFSGNLVINARGEFTVEYGRERFGIPSPLEQSRRHEVVLVRLLDRLGIAGRLGSPLRFEHVVMLHPQATITRPQAKALDTRCIIKADQIASWHENHVESLGVLNVLGRLPNMRSRETVQEWSEKLVRQHRPADPLALPEFMQSALARMNAKASPDTVSSPSHQALQDAEIASRTPPSSASDVAPAVSGPAGAPVGEEPRRRLVCASCGERISFAEGRFCWNNPERFGGAQYCRAHQAEIKPAASGGRTGRS